MESRTLRRAKLQRCAGGCSSCSRWSIALAGAATFRALWGQGATRTGVVTVALAGLRPGHARAVTVALPDEKHTQARIFVVRRRHHQVDAFLGVSTHLGCRLLLPGDPHYGDGFTVTRQHLIKGPARAPAISS
jgi:hypothetical protein